VRVARGHGKIERLALGLYHNQVPLIVLDEQPLALPLIVFDLPRIVPEVPYYRLRPHGLANTLLFTFFLPETEAKELKALLLGHGVRILA